MSMKNLLTTFGSAFAGGALAYASTHIAGGVPTTAQALGTFAAGAILTGLTAALHLYTPVPGSSK